MTHPTHDHSRAFADAFGVADAQWFLDKAIRDYRRYEAAGAGNERIDALVDFACDLIALEDWSFPGSPTTIQDWKAEQRRDSPEHTILALIALIAKHREVGDGRFARVRLQATDQIRVWIEETTPAPMIEWFLLQCPTARVSTLRTVVDDDQVVAYDALIAVEGLRVNGQILPMPTLMTRAIAHWQGVLNPPLAAR